MTAAENSSYDSLKLLNFLLNSKKYLLFPSVSQVVFAMALCLATSNTGCLLFDRLVEL